MDTLGYFLYMDEMEHRQKEQEEETLRELFGVSEDDEEE